MGSNIDQEGNAASYVISVTCDFRGGGGIGESLLGSFDRARAREQSLSLGRRATLRLTRDVACPRRLLR